MNVFSTVVSAVIDSNVISLSPRLLCSLCLHVTLISWYEPVSLWDRNKTELSHSVKIWSQTQPWYVCFCSLSQSFHDEANKVWYEVIWFCLTSVFISLSLSLGDCWESSLKRTYWNTWHRWPTETPSPSSSTELHRPSSSSTLYPVLCRPGEQEDTSLYSWMKRYCFNF